jgi:type II secretory pathway pseudopilin PulG
MTIQRARRRGFMMTELIVSMTVLGMLLIMFAISLDGFKRLNSYNLVRQRCVSAAQANLDSIEATGAAVDDRDMKRLWPDVSIKIDESEGQGQWKDLKLVTVTATAPSNAKKVDICLSRYFIKDNLAADTTKRVSVLQEK